MDPDVLVEWDLIEQVVRGFFFQLHVAHFSALHVGQLATKC